MISDARFANHTPMLRCTVSWRIVGYTEAIANLLPLTARAAYAASRISSNLKGTTKQFGWLQAAATKVYFLLITSANPATIRICMPQWRFEEVASKRVFLYLTSGTA